MGLSEHRNNICQWMHWDLNRTANKLQCFKPRVPKHWPRLWRSLWRLHTKASSGLAPAGFTQLPFSKGLLSVSVSSIVKWGYLLWKVIWGIKMRWCRCTSKCQLLAHSAISKHYWTHGLSWIWLMSDAQLPPWESLHSFFDHLWLAPLDPPLFFNLCLSCSTQPVFL